jgi:hypothetical protein
MREQELSKCSEIIARHTAALMAKISPAPEPERDVEVELVPGWTFGYSQFQSLPA